MHCVHLRLPESRQVCQQSTAGRAAAALQHPPPLSDPVPVQQSQNTTIKGLRGLQLVPLTCTLLSTVTLNKALLERAHWWRRAVNSIKPQGWFLG